MQFKLILILNDVDKTDVDKAVGLTEPIALLSQKNLEQ